MSKLDSIVPANGRVSVYPLPGARSPRRALAIVVVDGNALIDAFPVIRRLDEVSHRDGIEERGKVWSTFRAWLNGLNRPKAHHGWDKPGEREFSMLHVFRWDHPSGRHRRLYGFVTQARPDLEICALCCYRTKDSRLTERAVKRLIRDLSKDPMVLRAVRDAFKSEREGATWTIH